MRVIMPDSMLSSPTDDHNEKPTYECPLPSCSLGDLERNCTSVLNSLSDSTGQSISALCCLNSHQSTPWRSAESFSILSSQAEGDSCQRQLCK
ncbi:uncharacterized [Tachysurus ichikawai]